ncbi:MAG: GNAT family N-acetyltransferase [Microbacteriaceae bacterium]
MPPIVTVKPWAALGRDEFFEIASLRCQVFYVEQRVDEQEFDATDRAPDTLHAWVADAAGVAGYLRMTASERPELRDARRSFGRVAVRADRRGEGLARLLIDEVMARFGDEAMLLHAQEYIQPLYTGYGFEAVGGRYIEAGIPHVMMYRPAGGRPA